MYTANELARMAEVERINAAAAERRVLEERHGRVWDTEELGRDFRVLGFRAPYVIVARLSDGKKGTLEFQHSPRFYFNFCEG